MTEIKSLALWERIIKNSGDIINVLRSAGFTEKIYRNDVHFEKGDKKPGRLIVSIGAVKVWFMVQEGEQSWEIKQTAEFLAKSERSKALDYLLDEFIPFKQQP